MSRSTQSFDTIVLVLGLVLLRNVYLLLVDLVVCRLSSRDTLLELQRKSVLAFNEIMAKVLGKPTMKSISPKVRPLVSNIRKYPQTRVNVARPAQKKA